MIQNIQGIMAGQAMQGGQGISSSSPSVNAERFTDALQRAVESTDSKIQAGDRATEALAAGDSVGLHETVIAVEKADIALRSFIAVKNRVVESYQEIMRMQM